MFKNKQKYFLISVLLMILFLLLVKFYVMEIEKVIEKMCHAPADLYRVEKRGYIRPGYFADLVLIDPEKSWTVSQENILYFCAWSPFEGTTFDHKVLTTWVNGTKVYDNDIIDDSYRGKRLTFKY